MPSGRTLPPSTAFSWCPSGRYSLGILGVARSTDMRRADRNGVATFYGILAGASLILVTAIVI